MGKANDIYDVMIVGLGAIGSSTLYQLSLNRNLNILGLDQFNPPHTYGSHAGETRITREAIAEAEEYVPFVKRTNEILRDIEKVSGESLLNQVGGLFISSTNVPDQDDFFAQTLKVAQKLDIKHKLLNSNELRNLYPQLIIKDEEFGYYEYNAGYLAPEKIISTQLKLSKDNDATINTNEKLLDIIQKDGIVELQTDKGTYLTKKVILSTGAWVNKFFQEKVYNIFKVYREVLYWFEVEDEYLEFYSDKNFPVFLWDGNAKDSTRGFYGFPILNEGTKGLKVASEYYTKPTDPENIQREVTEREIQETYETIVKPHFKGVINKCLKSKACIYTNTPDYKFVIDFLDTNKNILLVSACSGHGFKHSCAIGQVASNLIQEKQTNIDITNFSLQRYK